MIRQAVRLFILVATIGVALLTLMSFLGKHAWLFELTSHFHVQYFFFLAISLPYFLIEKSKLWSGIVVACIVVNFIAFNPFWWAARSVKASQPPVGRLSLFQLNLQADNREHEMVDRLIRKENPDMVALMEFNQRWSEGLAPVLKDYPHRETKTREDHFGIGLFSRIPFEESTVVYYGEANVPSVVAHVLVGGKPVTVVAVHPHPSVSPVLFSLRNQLLEDLARKREHFFPRLIVIGDMNSSPYSYYFRQFMRNMDLQDTRHGFGVHPTWPVPFPIMLIPLDHCLISRGILTLDRKVGPYVGSDHYPLIITLGIE